MHLRDLRIPMYTTVMENILVGQGKGVKGCDRQNNGLPNVAAPQPQKRVDVFYYIAEGILQM